MEPMIHHMTGASWFRARNAATENKTTHFVDSLMISRTDERLLALCSPPPCMQNSRLFVCGIKFQGEADMT